MEYEAIMREWRRVLRPGGSVLIHWQPYYHPYGHHGQQYIPIPWVHLFLSHRGQVEVSARILDLPDFPAAWWDYRDGQRVNRFREALEAETADKSGFLNELTMASFEKECKAVGLTIEKRKLIPFSGPAPLRILSRALTMTPLVRELFTAHAIYTLKSP